MRTFLLLIIGFSIFFTACTNDPTAPQEEESSPYKVVYLANRQTNQGTRSEVHIADLDGSDDTLVFTSDTLFQSIAWVGNFFYIGTAQGSKGVVSQPDNNQWRDRCHRHSLQHHCIKI